MKQFIYRSAALSVIVSLSLAAYAVEAQGAPAVADHLKCYKIKDAQKYEANVNLLSAQLGDELDCDVKVKAKYYCVPVIKEVNSTNAPVIPFVGEEHLGDRLCYKVSCPKVSLPALEVSDQFGTRMIEKFKPKLLCTPATEGVPPTTTTTSTTSTTSTTVPACVDLDEDGYGDGCLAGPDCNDGNKFVNPAATEVCDGIDNDCAGGVDNGLVGAPCTNQTGVCSGSTQTCSAGAWQCGAAQYGPNYEATEATCDGLDNDCDGATDEGLTGPACVNQIGVCGGSTQTCGGAGGWQACGPAEYGGNYEAVEASCDDLDNDCDGQADEGLTGAPCPMQTGVCSGSTQTCSAGAWQCGAAEYGPNYEATETSCDAEDNDCDGNTDAGLTAPACVNQIGVCAGSTQTCGGAGGWQACGPAEYGPNYEASEVSCDAEDNDCDSVVDEGCP